MTPVSNFFQFRPGFGYLDELDAQMRLPPSELEVEAEGGETTQNENVETEASSSSSMNSETKQLGVQFRKKDSKHSHQEVKDDEPFQKMEFFDMRVIHSSTYTHNLILFRL